MRKSLGLLLLLVAGPVFAGPLDIVYDLPGSFWGRANASPETTPSVFSASFQAEQGIRFEHMKWVTFYANFTYWETASVAESNYYSYGIKNTTWLAPFTIGFERQNYIWSNPMPDQVGQPDHLWVGYISIYKDWNLKRN